MVMADPSDLGHGKKRKNLDQYCHIGDKYDILVTNIFILGTHTVILGATIILGTTTRHITCCITSVSSCRWSRIFSSDFLSIVCWLYCVFCVFGWSCLTVHMRETCHEDRQVHIGRRRRGLTMEKNGEVLRSRLTRTHPWLLACVYC